MKKSILLLNLISEYVAPSFARKYQKSTLRYLKMSSNTANNPAVRSPSLRPRKYPDDGAGAGAGDIIAAVALNENRSPLLTRNAPAHGNGVWECHCTGTIRLPPSPSRKIIIWRQTQNGNAGARAALHAEPTPIPHRRLVRSAQQQGALSDSHEPPVKFVGHMRSLVLGSASTTNDRRSAIQRA